MKPRRLLFLVSPSNATGSRNWSYLNELRSGEFEEGGLGLRCARPRHEGLPGAGRPVQQHALRRLDANVHKLLLFTGCERFFHQIIKAVKDFSPDLFMVTDGKTKIPCASWAGRPPRSTPGSACRGRRCRSTVPWAVHPPERYMRLQLKLNVINQGCSRGQN